MNNFANEIVLSEHALTMLREDKVDPDIVSRH